jgi:hypothetical protein
MRIAHIPNAGGAYQNMTARPVLLTPQREEKETYPYRRVWRTAYTEAWLLIGLTVTVILAARLVPLDEDGRRLFRIGFALLPLVLWLLISYRAERRALSPRPRLISAVILGGLVASGVGVPIIDQLFAVEEWLATADGLSRLLGYTLTVGMVQEFLKYAVLRYSLWPGVFRTRLDGVAYAMATAIGYATALNLFFALSGDVDPVSAALRIAEITLAQVTVSTIMGLALSELAMPGVPVYFVPLSLIIAAGLAGLAIVFRGGLVVGGIGIGATGNNAIFGLGQAVFLVVALYTSMSFLINSADERDRLRGRAE